MYIPKFSEQITNPYSSSKLYKLGEKADTYLSWSGRKFTWIKEDAGWKEESLRPQKNSTKIIAAIATLGLLPFIALISKTIYRNSVINEAKAIYYGSVAASKKVKNFDFDATLQFVDQLVKKPSLKKDKFYLNAKQYLVSLIDHLIKRNADKSKIALAIKKRGDLNLTLSIIHNNNANYRASAYTDYNTAAELGNLEGLLMMIEYSRTQNDYGPYKEWLEKGVAANLNKAISGLGTMYLNDGNYEKAIPLLKKVESSDPQANFNLALCYRDGLGGTKDLAIARKKLEEAASQGIILAKEYKELPDLGASNGPGL